MSAAAAAHRLEESPEDRAIGLEDGLALGLLDPLLQFSDLPLEFRLGDHAASGVPDLGRREGLRQVVNCAQLHRLDGRLKRGEGRDDDDPDFGLAAENLGQQRESRLLAQPEVQEDHIEPAPLDGLEGAGRRPHPHRPTAVGLQAEPYRLPYTRVVIDDQCGPDLATSTLGLKPRVPDRPINGIHSPATRSAVARA